MTDGHDADTPAGAPHDDPTRDPLSGEAEPAGAEGADGSPGGERNGLFGAGDGAGEARPTAAPSVPEGVRIIGAEEAQAALDTGHASPRKSENEMRFGDVPPRPDPSVRPAARFPTPVVPPSPTDDTAVRPVVPRVASPSAVPPGAPPARPAAGAGADHPAGAARLERATAEDGGTSGGGAGDDPDLEAVSDPAPHAGGPGYADDSIEVVLIDDDPEPPAGPESAAAASGPRPDPAPEGRPEPGPGPPPADPSAPMPLPHWTAPPTGEVPRILPEAEPVDMTDEEDFAAWAALAGGEPRFRSRAGDWDDDEAALVDALGSGVHDDVGDLGALSEAEPVDDDSVFAEQVARRRRIRSRSSAQAEMSPEVPPSIPSRPEAGSGPAGGAPAPVPAPARSGGLHIEEPADGDGGAEPDLRGPPAGAGRGPRTATATGAPEGAARRRPLPPPPAPEPAPQRGDLATRVVTGVAVAVVGLICLKLGAGATTVLAAVIVGLASFELYEGLRRATFRPAAILGILGSVGLVFAAYKRGDAAFPLIVALVMVFTLLWYLIEVVRARPTVNIGATLLGFAYVGVLGGFAGLTLALPDGVGIILGLVISAVGYDVFGFLIGSQFGRTRLAPTISPNKTVEGLLGGMSAALVLGVITSAVIGLHPWAPSIGRGLALGAVVAVMAPLGDLCESMLKRDLRVKDLGTLLPGHGGVLDRFDAILFCLPAVYYLALHLFG